MTVVAAHLYRHGERVREVTIDQKVDCPADRSEFVWIGIWDPTGEEMQTLKDQYGLHPLAIEDAVNANQLPKVDVYGDQLFVVARTAHLANDHIEYGETSIFIGHSHIVSVRHGSTRSHKALREQLEAAPTLLVHGVDYVLHAILDFIVDGYLPIIETIEDQVLKMEQRTLDAFLGRDDITRIFTLRRQMTKFQRVLGPMAEVAGKLVRLDLPCIDADTKPYFSACPSVRAA